MPYLDDVCSADERLGALHSEGLSEAWANIYLKFAIAIDAKNRKDEETLNNLVYPDIDAGIEAFAGLRTACARQTKGQFGLNLNK